MQLKEIMSNEYKMLGDLYTALVDQNRYLIRRETFSLDKIVKVIEKNSKGVAKCEIERRKITGNRSMREIINQSEDEELKKLYKNIVELLEKVQFQKDTNEALIKQWLGFTTQMLRAINPGKQPTTYNALGRNK
ncbi:flagellar protein FlgN [Clostridium tyrobutyricum]|uniref:flagellar protein FlgN n=1 Tax=Clostridium tyrobutyricum TaxID=1519 RepID=UPI0018A9118A|nr:flagellar protein FlgN [Clostridium tyrobutyricum]